MKDDQILDSWKEITEYLGRSRKTCLKWEKEFKLPIHRLDGTPKARVFAYKGELDRWLEVTLKGEEAPQKPFPSVFIKLASFMKSKKLSIPALVVVLAIISIAIWQIIPRREGATAPKIENSIAIISFENLTGDDAFDHLQKVIPNLLITNLENTGFFHVTTWERIRDLLKQMDKADTDIITSELGFRACQREGIKALVLGSFAKAGGTFVTDVKLLDVETKQLLKSASSRGEGEESIFAQVDELSKKISEGMGISSQNMKRLQKSIKDITTSSMDAYNYFLRGVEEYGKFQHIDSIRFLEKAIALDPEFAMAYLELGWVYLQDEVIDLKKSRNAVKKAKDLSGKVTDKERLYIEWRYTRFVEGDIESAEKIIKVLIGKYPREKRFHFDLANFHYSRQDLSNETIEELYKALELDPDYGLALMALGYKYSNLGNFEEAIDVFKRYASAYPGDPKPLDSMAETYLRWGELDDAIELYKETLEVNPEFHGPEWRLAYLYALKENYLETLKWMDAFIDKANSPEKKAEGYWWKGFYHGWLGNTTHCFDCLDKAANLVEGSDGGGIFWKFMAEWIKGWIYLDRGESKPAIKHFQLWFDRYSPPSRPFSDPFYSFILGAAALREGDINSAKSRFVVMESLLDGISNPNFKEITQYYYDLLQAEVHLFENSLGDSIIFSEKASMTDINKISIGRGTYQIAWYNMPFQRDVLARAYRRKEDIDIAIDWYERHISIGPQNRDRRLIPPQYHYKLATLYEQKGWKSRAIEQYQKFLDLWKVADPGRIEVEDARERLVRLSTD